MTYVKMSQVCHMTQSFNILGVHISGALIYECMCTCHMHIINAILKIKSVNDANYDVHKL